MDEVWSLCICEMNCIDGFMVEDHAGGLFRMKPIKSFMLETIPFDNPEWIFIVFVFLLEKNYIVKVKFEIIFWVKFGSLRSLLTNILKNVIVFWKYGDKLIFHKMKVVRFIQGFFVSKVEAFFSAIRKIPTLKPSSNDQTIIYRLRVIQWLIFIGKTKFFQIKLQTHIDSIKILFRSIFHNKDFRALKSK